MPDFPMPPSAGPLSMPGGALSGPPTAGPPQGMPSGPPMPQVRPPQPGNSSLISRVLGLMRKSETKPPPTHISDQLQAMTDLGMAAPQGASPGISPPSPQMASPPGNDVIDRIRGMLGPNTQRFGMRGLAGGGPVDPLQAEIDRRNRPDPDAHLQEVIDRLNREGTVALGGSSPNRRFARGGDIHVNPWPHPLQQYLAIQHLGRYLARGGAAGAGPSPGAAKFVQDHGQGDGRSDNVDARLSPGEFVMDAETTSMLGNGNSQAGARKLEELRHNIRQHKGKALAKGKFSPNAKQPESYLPKGALS